VRYVTADVLNLPAQWIHDFDLVAEIISVQVLARSASPPSNHQYRSPGRPAGTLLVIAAVHKRRCGTLYASPLAVAPTRN
jgi:hypothetical protein